MKRTTMFVPEALERDLQLYASRDGRPTAAIVREALAEYLARRRPSTGLPSFAGAFTSGRTDTAERNEQILFRHLSPHADPAVHANAPVRAAKKRKPARRRVSARRTGRRR